jgi:serine/threonine-protein kinase
MGDFLASEEVIDEPSDFGSLKPGTRLGRYELLGPIARGGMARVWAARLQGQRGFQKIVAIKTILPHLARENEFERMFLDEARIASGVHHPNVCEIYELGEEQRVLYLVMEWVTGDSFSRVLRASGRTEAVDPRVVARILADACAGLHSAHELTDDVGRQLGVVHRDLSPHNILLTADGVAKVADFGVAKALGQLHEQTSAGQLKGKVAYMSPEQISGTGIDRRSDVFSLGCVLYESTTGERPFKGDNDAQIMHAVLKGEFKPPSELMRGYPRELEHIVLRAMSPQAIVRFPTAESMRFALEEYLTRGPLVTQSNVAQVVRARIGEHLERRRERIRQASTVGDQGTFDAGSREQHPDAHRSGVKQAKPMHATLPLGVPVGPGGASGSQPPAPLPAAGQPPGAGYTPSPYSPSNVQPTGQNMHGGHMTGPQIQAPQLYGQTPHPPGHGMPAPPTPMDATRIQEYSNPMLARPPGMAGAMTGMPSMAPSSAPMSSPMGGPSPYARGGAAPVDPEETSNK